MNRLIFKILTGVFFCAASSFAVPTNAKSAITEASAAGQFLGLIFYEAQDASLTGLSSSIATFNKTSAKKITIYKAILSDPANKEIAGKYGIKSGGDLPLVLLMAPNGVITGGFPKTITTDQLKQSVSVSDLMLKTLKPLQEQKVVLVALQNAATKLNAESWAGVTDFTNDPQFKQFVTAIKADPSTSGSQDFIKQCQLVGPVTEATVVVLLPPGRIGKVLTGKLTKADILKSLQSCTPGSGCCSDRRFKKDIQPISSALEKVTKLQGVTFNWNQKDYPRRFFTDEPQIGVIAQDVETVIPEVVHTDKEGFKSVDYDKLTSVLIEAIKEMKKKMDTQDSLIQIQNARIKTLEGRK